MTQRTQVLLIDDLDGSSADETVGFGLDGSSYEIDLSTKNAGRLRDALAEYVAHGRKSRVIRGGALRRSTRSAGANSTDVRAWARSNGYSVNDRGRISTEVLDAYKAAT
jgi:hypothetical protein